MSAPLRILAAILGEASARTALSVLDAAGYVCVPRVPTEEMLKAAYWSAHEENAAGVWEDMILELGNKNGK